MPVQLIRGNALDLPLADGSVDLVVTSPPYFGLRSYTDGGEHYAGQLGAEATPAEFVDSLLAATREMARVLKPSGSIWINLGDRFSPGMHLDREGMTFVESKSLMGIPWRYAIRCIDDLGLILRAEVVWSKPNGLPESVTDRVRRSHETWFHFTKQPRYYSAVDELRTAHKSTPGREGMGALGGQKLTRHVGPGSGSYNPLGALPGSVWTIPTEPLRVPDHLGVDHYAAFPMEWPRRIITGWSPRAVCSACGEGRRPVVASVGLDMSRPQARRAQQLADRAGLTEEHLRALLSVGVSDTGRGKATQSGTGKNTPEVYALADEARDALGGYAREYLLRRPTAFTDECACPDTSAPSTPGVVLDPFGGTGTTALVADALGRHGISVDMSADYLRIAQWRTTDPRQRARAAQRDYTPPQPQIAGQSFLFGEETE